VSETYPPSQGTPALSAWANLLSMPTINACMNTSNAAAGAVVQKEHSCSSAVAFATTRRRYSSSMQPGQMNVSLPCQPRFRSSIIMSSRLTVSILPHVGWWPGCCAPWRMGCQIAQRARKRSPLPAGFAAAVSTVATGSAIDVLETRSSFK
jgi:hypothetical protein